MKQARIHGPGDLRLDEVEPPTAGAGDVVVKVRAAGICGTDLNFRDSGGPRLSPGPIVLGHEFAGEIVEVGPEVKSFKVGDRVAYNSWNSPTGVGRTNYGGGFGDYLALRDIESHIQSLCPVPDNLSLEHAALVEPLSVALHAVNRIDAKPGESVAIFGVGPIGLGAVIALRQRGVEDIVVFDPSALRRERALALGARAAADPLERPAAEVLKALRGQATILGQDYPLTDVYIEACGVPGLLTDLARMANRGARIVTVAMQKKELTFPPGEFLLKELTLMGSIGYPKEFPEVMAQLASGKVDAEMMITHRFPFSEFMSAFETAADSQAAAKVLLQFD